jgi:hypothetical protein
MYHNVGFAQGFLQHTPAPDQLPVEILRWLAINFIRDPDTQVKVVCMEVGPAGRVKGIISLEIPDAPGPAQAAFPGPPVQHIHIPAPDQLAAENLRRLAIRFIHHPDTQVEVVRMELGPAGRVKVIISLEIADNI